MTRPGGGKRRVILLVGAAMALGTFACEDNSTAPALTYPTTYAPLSAPELGDLTARFEDQNPGLCETLDVYGFVEDVDECIQSGGSVTCSNSDRLIELAKADVARNYAVTGVRHREDLQVRTSKCYEGTYSPRITLRFENQTWKGLEVFGTEIIAHRNNEGLVHLSGHHYPQIFVPPAEVSIQTAEESLVGKTLTLWPSYEYIVKEDSFVGEPFRVVYPYKVGDRIELRVTWSIDVVDLWRVYVDSVTGEEIAVEPLVVS